MASSNKPKCKYWNKCFRADKTHQKNFQHPGDVFNDDDEDETIGVTDNASNTVNTVGNSAENKPEVNLRGKQIIFVGTFTKKLEATARACGCDVVNRVSEDVDMVIAGTDPGKKGDAAKKLGLRIVSEDYWEDLLSRAVSSLTSKKVTGKASNDKTETLGGPTKPQARSTEKALLKRQRTHNLSDSEDEGPSAKGTLTRKRSKTSDSDTCKPALTRTRSKSSLDSNTIGGSAKPSTLVKTRSRSKLDDSAAMDTDQTDPGSVKQQKRTSESNDVTPPAKKQKVADGATGGTKSPKKIAKCKYWDKCYRKDKDHVKTFLHPGDDPSELEDPDAPKTMADGEEVDYKAGNRTYQLERYGKVYRCSCIGWKIQKTTKDQRTCIHLREYLGEDVECKRVGIESKANVVNKGGAATIFRAPRHKQVSLLLAHKWTDSQDPTGWWISEKLDGVRAYWDGKSFFSRLGNEFIPPPEFIKNYPTDMTLDGELFGGRAKFQSTVAIVKNAGSDRWKELEYHIFDAPSLEKEPFESRIKAMKDYFQKNEAKTAVVVEHTKCKGKEHIEEELKKVEALSGEGLMIREPKSKYEHRRSKTLLKIKNFYDAEARVIGYEPGKGSNTGKVGALRCVMECGQQFKVGSGLSDKERSRPPKIGSIITYKFQEYTNHGVPRFPSYIGVRIDASGPKDAKMPEGKMMKKDDA